MLRYLAQTRPTFSGLAMRLAAALSLAGLSAGAGAQGVETFDPDEIFAVAEAPSAPGAQSGGIDADLADPNAAQPASQMPAISGPQRVPAAQSGPAQVTAATQPGFDQEFNDYSAYGEAAPAPAASDPVAGDNSYPQWTDPETGATVSGGAPADTAIPAPASQNSGTYGEDDLIGAAEGVFGKGAEGLARMIQNLLKDQGEPNGYIVGREAGGAFVFGARYGSGTLHHKIEGTRKVYWTGPSVGFDVGANAANTFVLVYNLFDTQDLFKRYAAGEGQAYLIGGLNASYVRRGDVVLIPIRLGVGARLGINAGYMKFSEKQRWLPF